MKLSKRNKLLLQGLLGLLIAQPLMWWGLQHGSSRDLPVEWRAVVLITLDLLAFIWFVQSRSVDKTEVKPKWW